MKDYIYSLYNYFSAKPKLLWSVFGLIVLLLLLALSSVKFEEDISSFLPEKKSNQRVNHAYKQIGSTNKIMVIISAVDSARDGRESFLMEVADQFVEELKQRDTLGLTQEIFYKTDGAEITEIPQFIAKNIPLYLDEKDYQRIDSILATDGAISSIMQNNVALLQSPGSGMIKELMVIDPLYISSSALMKLRGVEATSGYHLKAGYIFDKAGESVLITLTSDRPSSETLLNKEWIKLIEESALSIENNHNQEVSIESIGSAIISLENADQIKRDTLLSVVIAVGLILIILFLFYRSFRSLLLISLSIVFGVLFSLAFLAIFKDSISIISVGVGSIIKALTT